MGVSLNPDDYTEGGGLIAADGDVDAVMLNPRFEMYDYDGQFKDAAPCLSIEFEYEGQDGNKQTATERMSCGSAKRFLPSKDGKTLEAVDNARSISSSCKAAMFLSSLVEAGFPADDLNDITSLDGVVVNVVRKAMPKLTGIARKEGERQPTVLAVMEILEEKASKKSGKTRGRPKGAKNKASNKASNEASKKTAKKEPEEDEQSIEEAALTAVTSLLNDKEEVKLADVPAHLLKVLKKDSRKHDIIQAALEDDFIAGLEEHGIFYEEDTDLLYLGEEDEGEE